MTSPHIDRNGHPAILYKEGGVCNNQGKRWQTLVTFVCNDGPPSDPSQPLGAPQHLTTDEEACRNTFMFRTVLACPNTTADTLVVPDTCSVYHSGTGKYVDIKALMGDKPYRIKDPDTRDGERYFEIQPCGRFASCNGSICMVNNVTKRTDSLGVLNDFMYEPTLESVRVRYANGDICNFQTGKRWTSKIYYTCDPYLGLGKPSIRETYDCQIMFDWRTSAFCEGSAHTLPPITLPPQAEEPLVPQDLPNRDEAPRAEGGMSWGMVFLTLILISTVGFILVLYKKPEARERVIRVLQETRARLPVVLGGRGRDDSTLLVSNGRFGSLADDDDFS